MEIETPLLPHALHGAAYLATQDENPFGSLIALYLVAQDPVSGVLVKLAGEVALNQETGQIVTTFKNTPQLPFENLRLHFFGEARAPLGTPASCGGYVTSASLAPWSGNEPSQVDSEFDITSGPDGKPCQGQPHFQPSQTAGTSSVLAGAFSPFTTTISREDGEQNLKEVSLLMPPGLSGSLTGIPLCPEALANAGACSPESLIGDTTVSVGLGGSPYTVTGGKVYLTGPYEGAPFGLSIVVPADAGPFHLGDVVVRAKIEVNPHTAQLTVATDASGPYAIPQMIDGIPLQIKHVNVAIDRQRFTFNPTNCSPLEIAGSMSGSEGAPATVSVPFRVTNCASLKFAPTLTVATSGRTSRERGASLTAKLTYPAGSQGVDANIAQVKVQLPKRLPSRLKTLQKACLAAQFQANPADCPKASVVGYAKAITPILPVALEGPAYFVSHGGEAFPSLIVVLQGYGVTVDIVGTTFISEKGITSATFASVPDVPVSSFELTLPEGKFSALGAVGGLCGRNLRMPTTFVAQDGVELHRSIGIAVTGCSKKKQAKKKDEKKRAEEGKAGCPILGGLEDLV